MNYRSKFLLILVSTIFVAYAAVGGVLGRATAKEGTYSQLSIFNEVLAKIRSNYVEDPNLTEVMHGALRGLLESLDPYSTFLSADEHARYKNHKTNGNGGAGLELSKEKILGYVYVIHPIEGGAADKAGVKAGDVIESIEEVSTRDISLVQAGYLLTGPVGSTVKLKILRRGRGDPVEISVVRDQLRIPPIKATLLDDRIGYVKIHRFVPGTGDEVRTKLQNLAKSGASKIILDLRNCAGDEFEEGIKVANLFLDHGVIAYTEGQRSPKREYVAETSKAICTSPMVVLQNYGSASASEIVTAAIKENRRGELVGVRSFGKASLQRLIPLESASAILLSIAKFYSQSGKEIQGNGISPDYEIRDGVDALEDADSQEDEEPPDSVAPESDNSSSREDLQLRKAIELLKASGTQKQKAA